MGNVINIGAPLSGKRVALSEVKDDLFKSSAMGPTIAIERILVNCMHQKMQK